MANPDIKKLKSSWTKYDIVQVVESVGQGKLEEIRKGELGINTPVLKTFLGVNDLSDPLPNYWKEVQQYSGQLKLFSLVTALFTHYKNIELFSEKYAEIGTLAGTFRIDERNKHKTNLRSALVVSGASPKRFRKEKEVPYDLSILFSNGEVGKLFANVLEDRLRKIGYSKNEIEQKFIKLCLSYQFPAVLSLTETQFEKWINGHAISGFKDFNYPISSLEKYKEIKSLKVNQWLTNWNDIDFDKPRRKKPDPHFLLFKIDVRLLKRLADVHRRKATQKRISDQDIQRGLETKRTDEIRKYVEGGFPWSTISKNKQKDPDYEDVKMPGILPTAIIANILGPDQSRRNLSINEDDLINVDNIDSDFPTLKLPDNVFSPDWEPELKPLEIIDGQHRLWAFEETEKIDGNYEVPVVAYYNLDRTWQAYLFYTINIKPKRINTSLGYDLYPLLRTQDWLENTKDGLKVYRETRAQELVEALWFYEGSSWYQRVNMLGQRSGGHMSQAAYIRALTDSYLRSPATRNPIGGLFSSPVENKGTEEIKWVRPQQAAFLISLWQSIAEACSKENLDLDWANKLRSEKSIQLTMFEKQNELDKAFASKNSLLARDQGVNGISRFSNDFFCLLAGKDNWDFNEITWNEEIEEKEIQKEDIDKALRQFTNHELSIIINAFAQEIVKFDWRTTNAPFENEKEKENQTRFKGSGGYREVWGELLKIFLSSENNLIKQVAVDLKKKSKVEI